MTSIARPLTRSLPRTRGKRVDDHMEFHDDLDNFEEAYCGEWVSEEDFARHIVSYCYDLEPEMGDLARYCDYEAFGSGLFIYDYSMGANGNVFRGVCSPLHPLSL